MKSLLVFICLPLLLYCQSRDYFFVPTMRAYNRMLCQSGLPGTENPLICPQNANTLQLGPQLYNQRFPYPPPRNQFPPVPPPIARQQRRAPEQPYLIPVVPLISPKREEPSPPPPERKPKKIYLIPWESQGEKPLVNYILVPDELLSPNAPLDTLDDERRLQLKLSRSRRLKAPNNEYHVYREHRKVPKTGKFSHHQERLVKEFRTVHSGHDGNDYEEAVE